MNTPTRCDNSHLFTQEVLDAIRPKAERLAKQTYGGLDANDLIQQACLRVWRGKKNKNIQLLDVAGILSEQLEFEYIRWAAGEHPERETEDRFAAGQQRYLANIEYPADDGATALTLGSFETEWIKVLDIECAVHTLNAEELQLVRWRFWDGLTNSEIGERLGLPQDKPGQKATQMTISNKFLPILEKLKEVLADYESLESYGKT